MLGNNQVVPQPVAWYMDNKEGVQYQESITKCSFRMQLKPPGGMMLLIGSSSFSPRELLPKDNNLSFLQGLLT